MESAISADGHPGEGEFLGRPGLWPGAVIEESWAMFASGELGRVRAIGSRSGSLRARSSGRSRGVPGDGPLRRLSSGSPGGGVVRGWTHVRPDVANLPKVRDLQHGPRYALHSLMDNFEGVGGEFFVAGRVARVDDPTLIATASIGKHDPEQYVLFGVEAAIGTTYEGDEPVRHRWRAN